MNDVISRSLALLGTVMKDRVTGFTGMVSSVSFDAYGCVQCVLTPPKKKDGTLGDGHWFDVKRLQPVGAKQLRLMAPNFDKAFGDEGGAAEKPAMR